MTADPAAGGPPLCPSGRARAGAVLVGVVGADARIGYLQPRMRVDDDWLAEARAAGNPDLERRFRFAEPCRTDICGHWKGDHCGVAAAAVQSYEERAVSAPVSACAIRRDCRWFAERGTAACRACTFVVRNVGPTSD